MMDSPVLLSTVSLPALWASAQIGAWLRRRRLNFEHEEQEDIGVVLAAAMTLLGLIIGFSFSMAVSRYDLRKTCEAEEANAIGTEYVRAGLLPGAEAERVRTLLRDYIQQRILFYTTDHRRELARVDAATTRLQEDMWSTVQDCAAAIASPPVTLAAAGMNDVLNSQGYTQAAWWNRIPPPAWALMGAIAICCNVLFGFGARHAQG